MTGGDLLSQQYWLLKSEPQTFSIDDLAKAKNQTTVWDGVRNYQARNTLRDDMKVGDLGYFYHSSCPEPGIVGIVKIVKTGIADPTAFDPKSPYFDPKSSHDNPRWITVEVKLVEKLTSILSLSQLRETRELEGFTLLRKGNRLSVFSVTSAQWQTIQKMIQRKTHAHSK
jgi:predicted RNA-binding protein with PUA-like domain